MNYPTEITVTHITDEQIKKALMQLKNMPTEELAEKILGNMEEPFAITLREIFEAG